MKDEDRLRSHTDGFVPGTFSIAARDSDAGEFGVAVSTALVGVGALCPFVSENGAVATQSFVKVSHGSNAIDMIDRGVGVDTALDSLITDDEHAGYRQVHGLDDTGKTYAFSGADCVDWYGHLKADDHTVAGNMLEGEDVIETMSETFRETDGELAERLMETLEAGQAAGGDKRGKISAALLVHSPESKMYHNLRIDESDDPVADLRDAFELGKQTEADLPASADDMLGEYPDEILDFGIKH
jgi:Uncharacterized conserved protein